MSAMSRSDGVWPSRDDYQAAVIHPARNLKDSRLHTLQVETRKMGVMSAPYPRSGNFGAVYKFSDGPKAYALKVFDKAQPDREQRYTLVDRHLKTTWASPSLVSFHYDQQGILVGGRWYPCLVMDWVEGPTLDRHLAAALGQRGQADNRALCQAWVDLVLSLIERRVAHGDLQHGNILVLPDGSLKLVDYDGMFVPEMRQAGLTAAEIGLPAYQHPKRYRGYFDERLDDFAALSILLSLAAVDAGRWQRYHADDNCLIVRESDLLRPDQSPLIRELAQSPDAPLRKLAMMLKAASLAPLDAIPSFKQVIADSTIKQLFGAGWRPTASATGTAHANASGAGQSAAGHNAGPILPTGVITPRGAQTNNPPPPPFDSL
jgi:hypothetical protein